MHGSGPEGSAGQSFSWCGIERRDPSNLHAEGRPVLKSQTWLTPLSGGGLFTMLRVFLPAYGSLLRASLEKEGEYLHEFVPVPKVRPFAFHVAQRTRSFSRSPPPPETRWKFGASSLESRWNEPDLGCLYAVPLSRLAHKERRWHSTPLVNRQCPRSFSVLCLRGVCSATRW